MKKLRNNIYDSLYYENQQEDSYNSAKIVLPKVLDVLPKVDSAVDFGCGIGTWLLVLKELGVSEIKGYDGPWVDKNMLKIPPECFSEMEFNKDVSIENKKYDLAISMEVAEHLPQSSADFFIKLLTTASDFVLFSAAIPFQEGPNHVNLQWPNYWNEFFNKNGFVAVDFLRSQIWNEENVMCWYKQNAIMFVKKERLNEIKTSCYKNTIPLSLVHPELYLMVVQDLCKKS